VLAAKRKRPTVFIYRPIDSSGESHAQLVAAGCEVIVGDGQPIGEQSSLPATIHALLGATHTGEPISREQLKLWPALRIVSKYTIGTDDVDVDAATDFGILVTHSPTEANWGGVAEGAFAMILCLLKKLPQRDRAVKSKQWRSAALEGTYLGAREDGYPGITVGIIGLGRIGGRLAGLLSPWQVKVLATDPYVEEDAFSEHNAEKVELDQLLSEADVVSVHCNLTGETAQLINASRLALMRPGAIFINTARGGIVDLEAVCDALAAGQLAAAALDVFPEEPLPGSSRIITFGDRVLLSPHMVAANTGGTLQAAIPWATQAVQQALRGRVPMHVYNEAAIPAWRARFEGKSLL
jgi:D-3-phosphoglycerate dehydrogenase